MDGRGRCMENILIERLWRNSSNRKIDSRGILAAETSSGIRRNRAVRLSEWARLPQRTGARRMELKKPNKGIPVRKKKIISFRIGDDESEELNAILKYTGVPARSQSSVLRLAIPFIHRSIQDGMALGAADVGQDKPFNKRYERYRNGNDLDFLALGYNIGFRGEDTMLYRVGKAQGEMDARVGKPDANVLSQPLSVNSSNYAVGYFDGCHGGYMAGLAKGYADKEKEHLIYIGEKESAPEDAPEGDPVYISCFAIGYRTGRHSEFLITPYQKGSVKGTAHRDAGEIYNPNPYSGEGLDPYMDEGDERRWIAGYHDGYQGGCAAGMLEGEADRNNGKPYQPPSGRVAHSDFAIGYRTAYRSSNMLSENDGDGTLYFSKDGWNGLEEYKDGWTLGMEDRQNDRPNLSQHFHSPGFHASAYSSFAAGYRDGYGPENQKSDYIRGYWEGQHDRENNKPSAVGSREGLERVGYHAGYYERPLGLRPTEPKGLE